MPMSTYPRLRVVALVLIVLATASCQLDAPGLGTSVTARAGFKASVDAPITEGAVTTRRSSKAVGGAGASSSSSLLLLEPP